LKIASRTHLRCDWLLLQVLEYPESDTLAFSTDTASIVRDLSFYFRTRIIFLTRKKRTPLRKNFLYATRDAPASSSRFISRDSRIEEGSTTTTAHVRDRTRTGRRIPREARFAPAARSGTRDSARPAPSTLLPPCPSAPRRCIRDLIVAAIATHFRALCASVRRDQWSMTITIERIVAHVAPACKLRDMRTFNVFNSSHLNFSGHGPRKNFKEGIFRRSLLYRYFFNEHFFFFKSEIKNKLN